jgi:hypothetical protein
MMNESVPDAEVITYRTEAALFAANGEAAPSIVSPGDSEVRYREVMIPNYDAAPLVASIASAVYRRRYGTDTPHTKRNA